MRRLIPVVALLALVVGCEDILGPDDGAWSYSQGTDNISGRPYATASLNAGSYPQMTLIVRCKEGSFDVYVNTGFITESSSARYRIDSQTQRLQSWGNSTDFRSLFYPGDARAFAAELAAAEVLVFEAREFGGGVKEVTFTLPGLDARLPTIREKCS